MTESQKAPRYSLLGQSKSQVEHVVLIIRRLFQAIVYFRFEIHMTCASRIQKKRSEEQQEITVRLSSNPYHSKPIHTSRH
jgi:hypothetical protein